VGLGPDQQVGLGFGHSFRVNKIFQDFQTVFVSVIWVANNQLVARAVVFNIFSEVKKIFYKNRITLLFKVKFQFGDFYILINCKCDFEI